MARNRSTLLLLVGWLDTLLVLHLSLLLSTIFYFLQSFFRLSRQTNEQKYNSSHFAFNNDNNKNYICLTHMMFCCFDDVIAIGYANTKEIVNNKK